MSVRVTNTDEICGHSFRRGESHVRTETDTGVMQLQVKERQEPNEARKREERTFY